MRVKNLIFFDGEHEDYPSLGPYLFGLTILGIRLRPEKPFKKFFSLLIPSFTAMVFGGVYLDLYYAWGNFLTIAQNLSICILATIALAKIGFFLFYHQDLYDMVDEVSKFEVNQIKNDKKEVVDLLMSYKKSLRRIGFAYMVFFMYAANFWSILTIGLAIKPLKEGGPLVGVAPIKYVMFDKLKPSGFFYGVFLDTCFYNYLTSLEIFWDIFVVGMMNFFTAQFDILKLKLSWVFDEDGEDVNEKIILCYKQHLFLLETSKRFNDIIGPVMFAFFLLSSMAICSVLLEIIMLEDMNIRLPRMGLFCTMTLEIFILYWHSNETMVKSQQLSDGASSAIWYNNTSTTIRKSYFILLTALDRPTVFSAGPFHNMNNATFIMIMKTAYSFYTLMLQTSGNS